MAGGQAPGSVWVLILCSWQDRWVGPEPRATLSGGEEILVHWKMPTHLFLRDQPSPPQARAGDSGGAERGRERGGGGETSLEGTERPPPAP